MLKNLSVITFLICNISTTSIAQEKLHIDRNITANNGLSENTITGMLQDEKGFVWIATYYEGLMRYDGNNFKRYKFFNIDSVKMTFGNILDIIYDSKQNLWIGTTSGLFQMNTHTGEIKSYTNDSLNIKSLSNNYIHSLTETYDTCIWMGTNGGGISKYNYKTDDFTNYIHNPNDSTSIPSNFILVIEQDIDSNLWIGSNRGLFKIDARYTSYQNNLTFEHKNIGSRNTGVIEITAEKNNLWIGTRENGLTKYNIKTDETYVYDFVKQGMPIGYNRSMIVFEDSHHYVWVGHEPYGVGFTQITPDNQINHYLKTNRVRSMMEDASGVLWIGTWSNGIKQIYPKTKIITNYQHDENKNSLSNNTAWSIFEHSSGDLWIGTGDLMLNRFNATSKLFSAIDLGKIASLNEKLYTWTMHEDSEHNLWIGTHSGLFGFNYQTETFTHFPVYSNNKGVMSIADYNNTEKTSKLLISIEREGIFTFDINTHVYEECEDFKPLDANNLDIGIIEKVKNDFWLTDKHHGSLIFYNKNKHQISKYKLPYKDEKNTIIYSLASDEKHIWMGIKKGLVKFHKEEKTFTLYNEEHGLSNNSVWGIIIDNTGNIWASTNEGLNKFDPIKEEFRTYYAVDGFQSNEFNAGVYSKGKSGKFYFGGINGVSAFYPEDIKDNLYIPPVAITNLKILNEDVYINQEVNGHIILQKDIRDTKEITLTYKDYVLTLEFSAQSYISPKENQYAYILEGFEEKWNYVGKRRFATYTNLPQGEYIFKVIACNNDEVWNKTGSSLKIIVLPPFWKTWWFITLVIIFIFGGIFFWYKKRLNRMKEQNMILEQTVIERTTEIQEKNINLQKSQEEIKEKNIILQESQEEIQVQNEELSQLNEEITVQKENLELVNNDLESKNTLITDSINYAKRIQDAILPAKENIESNLPESFIFYRPRHTVSGDFYWFTKHGDNLFIAAVDCTGHGVPGAFMSMIGNTLLSEIVNEKKIFTPSLILQALHAGLIKVLAQQKSEDGSMDDGMDVSLCCINYKKKEIQFAGANLPLFIIQNKELITYKGDIYSIGGAFAKRNEIEYKNHLIKIEKGMRIYLFSDGYQDQFGGPEDFKYTSKRFKQLLFEIHSKPMGEQLKYLSKEFDHWKKETNQIDDVMVIGVKI